MGKSKVENPYGRVLHDRGTSSAPSPPTGVKNERKPDMHGTQEGSSKAEWGTEPIGHTHLGHAVEELHSQHPHHHSVGGIHHTKDHVRHLPMHGMNPGGRHEYSAKMSEGSSHAHPEHNSSHLK